MIRDLIIDRIKSMLHGAAASHLRWVSFANYLYFDVLGHPDTKAGRRAKSTFDIASVDYAAFDDAQLVAIFEFVCRKAYAQF